MTKLPERALVVVWRQGAYRLGRLDRDEIGYVPLDGLGAYKESRIPQAIADDVNAKWNVDPKQLPALERACLPKGPVVREGAEGIL